jgi:hypothetical protein
LFERVRPPLAEKPMPLANCDWPVTVWLTPGADSATL